MLLQGTGGASEKGRAELFAAEERTHMDGDKNEEKKKLKEYKGTK